MEASPINHSQRLYRKAVLAVIFTVLVFPFAFAQYAKKRHISKGPRAVGLIELAQNGKAHLLPVTIMIDGKFYDAAAYKADPVPMALQPDTVYEAVKSGAPQGLFTVSGALPEKDSSWVADGKWRSNADIEADKTRLKAERARLAQKAPEESSGPPRLRRGSNSEGDQSSSPSQPSQSGQPSSSQKPPGGENNPPASSAPKDAPKNKENSAASGGSTGYVDAPDRPVLRRQSPTETTHEQTKDDTAPEPLKGPIQFIPAISDAAGPESHPYTYELKPEEEQNFQKKMLAMASDEVEARAAHLLAESEPAAAPAKTPRRTARSAKAAHPVPSPELHNLQLRIFDLTSSNEPVLVLTADASIPGSKLTLQYSTALVAREDIYGELHKVFAQTTDNQHLDVLPKYEFIDAVDADGDGRGELLFRTTSDSGQAFSIYAVIGDRLWPLFEGRSGA